MFLNACAAYEVLWSEMKERLSGLLAENVYDYEANPTVRSANLAAGIPQFWHLIVIVHPMSGEAFYTQTVL